MTHAVKFGVFSQKIWPKYIFLKIEKQVTAGKDKIRCVQAKIELKIAKINTQYENMQVWFKE